MLNQERHKGQYIKTETLDKIKKAVEATAEAILGKRNRENFLEAEEIEVSPWSGRRITELTELLKIFKCSHCCEVILLQNITDARLSSLLRRLNNKYGNRAGLELLSVT